MAHGSRVIAGAACVLAVAACRQIIGIGDPDPPVHCDAPATAAPACGACLAGGCCAELEACRAEGVCRSLLDCRAACSDDGCRGGCESAQRLTPASADLLACEASRCAGDCGLVCGGAGAPFAGCSPCAATCCDEGAARDADRDYQALRVCRDACGPSDPGCREACVDAHAAGADVELAADDCVARACDIDADWSCVGEPEPQASGSGTITLDLQMIGVPDLAPVVGAKVKACSVDDLGCPAPYDAAWTNEGGWAKLSIDLAPGIGFDAYAGFVAVDRDGFAPTRLYFVPPLTHSPPPFARFLISNAQVMQAGTVAPDRGSVIVTPVDCRGLPARGVALHADTAAASSATLYLASASAAGGSIYDPTATATTARGIGVLLNLPAGDVNVTASVPSLCRDVARYKVHVWPGAITYLPLPPTL